MSLILDALNRADQERSTENKSPTLQVSHSSNVANERPVKRWIVEIIVIVLAIVVGLYVYNKSNNSEVIALEIHSPNTVDPNPAASSPAPAIQETPKAIAEKDSINTTRQSIETQLPAVSYTPQPQNQAITQTVDKAAISSLYEKEETSTAATSEKKPNELDAIPPAKIDNTQSILATIPLLSEHSLSFQRSVPTIEYSIHAYSDQGGFVILNSQKYRVGGKLSAQLRVIAILKDSVVLDFNGKQFRLLALNSWINI